MLKKDIRTKDKDKFSTPWDEPFIIVDAATAGTYVLAEVDGGMLPNTWNADQLCKYYVWYVYMIKEAQFFFAHEIDILSVKNLWFFTRIALRTKTNGLPISGSLFSKNLYFLHA
jgi:hypothetical protein